MNNKKHASRAAGVFFSAICGVSCAASIPQLCASDSHFAGVELAMPDKVEGEKRFYQDGMVLIFRDHRLVTIIGLDGQQRVSSCNESDLSVMTGNDNKQLTESTQTNPNYVTAEELTQRNAEITQRKAELAKKEAKRQAEADETNMRKARERTEEERYGYIGKTYWIIPKPDAKLRVTFYTDPSQNTENFFPIKTTSFIVVSVMAMPFGALGNKDLTYFAKIRFYDGKAGYIPFQKGASLLSAEIYRENTRSVWNPSDREFIYERTPYDLARDADVAQRKAEKLQAQKSIAPKRHNLHSDGKAQTASLSNTHRGSMRNATLGEWSRSPPGNQLESVADMVGKVLKVTSPAITISKAHAVRACMRVVAKEPMFDSLLVAEIAVGCMQQLNYL